jgi:hypothetical protein
MSKKLAEELATKVVGGVIKSGVRQDMLDGLLRSVEVNVREEAVQAILIAYGQATMERDKAWVTQLHGEWSPKSGLKTATNPAEVEQEIRAWMAARIQEARHGAYQTGYEDAFPVALEQGIRLGWATHEAGKGLEEALKAGTKVNPK